MKGISKSLFGLAHRMGRHETSSAEHLLSQTLSILEERNHVVEHKFETLRTRIWKKSLTMLKYDFIHSEWKERRCFSKPQADVIDLRKAISLNQRAKIFRSPT